MTRKSSAHYQREFRRRLREQGLVKKEVWIRPENTQQLAAIEKQLRNASGLDIGTDEKSREEMENSMVALMDNPQVLPTPTWKQPPWTTAELYQALLRTDLFAEGEISIDLIESQEASLHITLHEYGSLPVYLTVAGDQIVVEAILWPVNDVINPMRFNDVVLRTHKYYPLSTISLDTAADGTDYYQMFGALSATSILPNIIFEIEVLANNVIQATEVYAEFLQAELHTAPEQVSSLKKLHLQIKQAEANIKRLQQQVDTTKAVQSVQRAQAAVAERHSDGGLRTALDSFENLKEKQQKNE